MNPKDQIKQALNILDVVSTYIRLEKSGKQYKARCPFHNEKSPSFFVSPERGVFHCFGCSAHGDIFSFVEKIENLSFYESLKILADRAGIKLTPFNSAEQNQGLRLLDLLEISKKYFQKNLQNSPAAKKYLSDRGLNEESIQKHEIGFATGGEEGWRSLFNFLSKENFTPTEMVQAGLMIKKDFQEKYFDRFRGRIMFPIKNLSGVTLGFSARILPELDDGKAGKYINSPETEIYHKSKILFGYDLAKKSIAEKKEVILVEGQMDLILSQQVGVENIVATSGTAFSDAQIKILKRFADKVLLSFDADSAGEMAMKKTAILCLFGGLDVLVIPKINPDDTDNKNNIKDVADIVLKLGAEVWKKQITKSLHIVEYLIQKILQQDISERDKLKAVKIEIFPILRAIEGEIDRNYFIRLVAKKLNVDENHILHDLKNFISTSQAEFRPRDSKIDSENNLENPDNSHGRDLNMIRKDNLLKEILAILKWQNLSELDFLKTNLQIDKPDLKKEIDLQNIFQEIFFENKKDFPEEIIESEILRLENILEKNKEYQKDKLEKPAYAEATARQGKKDFIQSLLSDLFRNYKIEILLDLIKTTKNNNKSLSQNNLLQQTEEENKKENEVEDENEKHKNKDVEKNDREYEEGLNLISFLHKEIQRLKSESKQKSP